MAEGVDLEMKRDSAGKVSSSSRCLTRWNLPLAESPGISLVVKDSI
jgi:hypothetical protein